jgi:hypothetical protein
MPVLKVWDVRRERKKSLVMQEPTVAEMKEKSE